MADWYPWWVPMARSDAALELTQGEWCERWYGYNRALGHVLLELYEATRVCEEPGGLAVLAELKAQLCRWIEQEADYVAHGHPYPGAPPYPHFPALPPVPLRPRP
jgi:hypothetical protein